MAPTHHKESSPASAQHRVHTLLIAPLGWVILCLIGIAVLPHGNELSTTDPHQILSFPNSGISDLKSSADALKKQWHKDALLDAIAKYEEASKLFEDQKQRREAAESLFSAGELYFYLSDYQKSVASYARSRQLYELINDRDSGVRVSARIGLVSIYLGQSKKAIGLCRNAINYFSRTPKLSHSSALAEAYHCAGEASYSLSKLRESFNSLQRALTLWTELADDDGIGLARLNLGYARSEMGENDQAQVDYTSALTLFRKSGNKRGEALALTILGTMHSFNGDSQVALDTHQQAIELFSIIGDYSGEAVALNSIGKIYEDLNKLDTALDNYNKALTILEQRGNIDFQPVTNYYVGRTYNRMGEPDKGLIYLERSLSQSENLGQERVSAYALSTISAIRSQQGFTSEAIKQLQTAIQLYQAVGDRRGRANSLNELGRVQQILGDHEKALLNFRTADALYRASGDKAGEAESLYLMALAEGKLGHVDKAITYVKESNATTESLRSQIISPQLKASYFSSVHKQTELLIALLMKRYQKGDSLNSISEAFNASEKAHSRSLLERLGENRLNIRKGADPSLLEKERSLQQRLRAKSLYHMSLLATDNSDAQQSARVKKEIRELTTECDALQTEIKQKSSAYANLVQPEPLSLQDVQSSINDSDTLLLQYSFGADQSYLFVLTATTLQAFALPGRAQLEAQVRNVIELLTARENISDSDARSFNAKASIADEQYWIESQKLSATLLGPVAGLDTKKRLLIVADGLLHHLPFDALPSPTTNQGAGPNPLILAHEIINLPSASTLAAIRKQNTVFAASNKLIAIIADPVFSTSDARLAGQTTPPKAATDSRPLKSPETSLRDPGSNRSKGIRDRLPATRREAEAIMATAPPGTSTLAMGFDARREFVVNGELAPYRVVHFGTHGFVDDENPDVSGIFLSMVNRQGLPEEGFLPLNEVYNLDLEHTQLVVVSACQSALGKELYGEGLVSLARGFMYAGCKSVVASLWKVDDEATSVLMSEFYVGIFKEGLTPAAALRRAKMKMLKNDQFHSPFFWAAFVLQGEYRDTVVPPVQSGKSRAPTLIVLLLLAVLVGGGVSFYLFKRKVSKSSINRLS